MDDKKGLPSLPSLPAGSDRDSMLLGLAMPYDPDSVKGEVMKELEGKKAGDKISTDRKTDLVKAMNLREFHHGLLMAWGLKDEYQTFAVQLSRDYQAQYKCETAGRKSLAELSALNYCRILEIQRRINNVLENNTITDQGNKYIATMSKELDRAQRHYLTAMQALELGLQAPMNVSVRTQVANIATQQMVQEQILKDKKEYDI